MRAYRVALLSVGKVRYAGSNQDAKTTRAKLLHNAGLGPRSSEATIAEVEIPTGKVDLLDFINAAVSAGEARGKGAP